jgi:hypothetical protein
MGARVWGIWLRYTGQRLALLAKIFLCAGIGCYGAAAQEFLNPGNATLDGYQAPGITSGDFLIKQAVSFGIAYDSNILQSHSHNIQDVIFFVSPFIDIIHDTNKSIQEVIASATAARYLSDVSDNYTDLYVSAKETYFLSPASAVTALASFSDGYQRRISRNFDIPVNAATPVPEQILLGSLGYRYSWANYEAGLNFTASAENFRDVRSVSGTILDQQFRNERDLLLDSFFNIQLSSHLRSNLVLQASDIEYQLQTRNFTQWRIANTITADLTSKTSVGVLVALKEQNLYNNPAVHLGLLGEYAGLLTWRPTQLLSFNGTAGYRDYGVDYVQGIFAGGFAPYYSLDASYSLWHNLRLDTGVQFEKRYLPGRADIENILNYKAALTYELSRYAGVSFLANTQQWLSRQPTNTFNETTFQTSLNLRF